MSRILWMPLIAAMSVLPGQTPAVKQTSPTALLEEQRDDAAGFKDFAERVQTYIKLERSVESGLPALKATDLPEMIAAHQHALARKLREARPGAKRGDLFTAPASEAFRHASRATFEGPKAASSRAYMQSDAPDPAMPLAVNDVYPDMAPVTPLSPELLAAYPPLPPEVAYRIVGRTLLLMDAKSNMVIDFARLILPAE